jgi:hypothetical protein
VAYSNARSSFFCPPGTKWYWEYTYSSGSGNGACGITTNSHELDINPGGGNSTPSGHGVGFYIDEVDHDGTRSAGLLTASSDGDIIGVGYDVDGNSLRYYLNGTLDYTYTSVPTSTDGPYSPSFGDFSGAGTSTIYVNFGQDSSFAGEKTAQGNQDGNGKGDFYYAPPTDYLALCTDNLSAPEIALPGENFETVIWSGDDSTSRSLTVGLTPDFAWAKRRNGAQANWLFDTVRGDGLKLQSDSSGVEVSIVSDGNGIAFASNGVTIGSTNSAYNEVINESGGTYVGWFWKSGGAPTADNDNTAGAMDANSVALNGSLQAAYTPSGSPSLYPTKMSINTTNGFSIISYTSPGATSDKTIPHGLSQAPEMVMVKNLDSAYNWDVWSPALSSGYDLKLNDNAAQAASRWSTTIPSASLITLLDTFEVNGTDDYIAYCFHSIEGYSKVMSWSGNSSTNGVFMYTGFRPAFVMGKCINTSESWFMLDNKRDTYNYEYKRLFADSNSAESTGDPDILDFVSNGIKMRNSGNSGNISGRNYIGIAFAESPFKTSNSR